MIHKKAWSIETVRKDSDHDFPWMIEDEEDILIINEERNNAYKADDFFYSNDCNNYLLLEF